VNRLLTEWRTADVSPQLDVSASAGGVKSVGRLALRQAWETSAKTCFQPAERAAEIGAGEPTRNLLANLPRAREGCLVRIGREPHGKEASGWVSYRPASSVAGFGTVCGEGLKFGQPPRRRTGAAEPEMVAQPVFGKRR
jgi:hypothetical protein